MLGSQEVSIGHCKVEIVWILGMLMAEIRQFPDEIAEQIARYIHSADPDA